MSHVKLVKTLLLPGNNKYEIYAKNENGNVERIIHYKLRSCKNEQGQDGMSEAQWVIYNPLFPLPDDRNYASVSNIDGYLTEY
ncbi:hypothetical protein AB5D03_000320 [Salmonella enterica]|uniref:Uncharacterized protein n=1 Tax=Salmonella enterica TaxID=28901 RepID=A0A747PNR9_SALER|nr:hypothetical protein [Salmonella enterica]EBS6311398.1 hypothetical protein [Salmonella enterica subsp. enterica serovar Millesi]ECF4097414.1 hypothetical protein [Salmonella enterica subsp. enterica serovar Adelaide]EDW8957595.1 hypothetical protein [Salmonella enterica subsp. enterica]MJU51651.1 hypothetical protein [Salmonella enterica subsp. enterica serovar Coquilhatville]